MLTARTGGKLRVLTGVPSSGPLSGAWNSHLVPVQSSYCTRNGKTRCGKSRTPLDDRINYGCGRTDVRRSAICKKVMWEGGTSLSPTLCRPNWLLLPKYGWGGGNALRIYFEESALNLMKHLIVTSFTTVCPATFRWRTYGVSEGCSILVLVQSIVTGMEQTCSLLLNVIRTYYS